MKQTCVLRNAKQHSSAQYIGSIHSNLSQWRCRSPGRPGRVRWLNVGFHELWMRGSASQPAGCFRKQARGYTTINCDWVRGTKPTRYNRTWAAGPFRTG